ncbi:hypothetical protein ABT023_11165 [Micromonospora sp. NPDC002296]
MCSTIGLSIYLSGLHYEAVRDLYRLNPDDGPAPGWPTAHE